MNSMEVKVSLRLSALKMSQFWSTMNLELSTLITEQMCKVFMIYLALRTYAMKDGWIPRIFSHFSRQRNVPVSLLNGVRVLLLVLEYSQEKVHVRYEMEVPTVLMTQIYFHTKSLISKEGGSKKLRIVRYALNSKIVIWPFSFCRRPGMRSRSHRYFGKFELWNRRNCH